MIKLLLDEHISPRVAQGLRTKNPKLVVHGMGEWDGGVMLGQEDEVILRKAAVGGFTLVTFDLKTILPLIRKWAEEERPHAGVILIDERTIFQGDIGELIRSLTSFVARHGRDEWRDRVRFLERAAR
jgi:hypothetical protein